MSEVSRTEPTEDSDGKITERCSVCGYEKITTIPKLKKNTADTTAATKNTEATTTSVETTAEPTNPPTVTKEEFLAIETGMTYEEVVAIIGGDGELSSESSFGEGEYKIETQLYIWYGEGDIIRGNMSVIFQNGEVTSKSQYGLE